MVTSRVVAKNLTAGRFACIATRQKWWQRFKAARAMSIYSLVAVRTAHLSGCAGIGVRVARGCVRDPEARPLGCAHERVLKATDRRRQPPALPVARLRRAGAIGVVVPAGNQ